MPAVTPSTVLGVIKPIKQLHRAGKIDASLTLEYLASRPQVRRADVILFCRNTKPAHRQALEWALADGKPIIYDLDDDLLDLPADIAEAAQHNRSEYRAQLLCYLHSADVIRVYARRLQEKLGAINLRARQVAGPLDWSAVPSDMRPAAPGAAQPVRFVYATSRTEDRLFSLFQDAVQQLQRAYPHRAEFTMWGFRAPELESQPGVRFLRYDTNYDRFFRRFARSGFDVGLAPLPNEDFYLSKSNNKFREYSACRIAGIYSNVPVYAECVSDGRTGLLVDNQPGAWFAAMERLLLDAELRRRIQAQAQQYARAHYDQESFCRVWLEQIQTVLESREPRRGASTVRPHPPATPLPAQPAPRAAPLAKVVGLLRDGWRMARSGRARGLRWTVTRVRFALNDLTLLFWK